jgi:hypothetical protein
LRWLVAGAELGYARVGGPLVSSSSSASARTENDATWFRVGGYAGARLPLSYAALSAGLSSGYDSLPVDYLSQGFFEQQRWPQVGYLAAWTTLDVHVLCDLAITTSGEIAGIVRKGMDEIRGSGFHIGAAFQPNRTCRRERATDFGLRTQ